MAAVILCISYSGLKLGAAYYEEDNAEIKILYDTAEDNNFFLLKALLNEAKPTQIIINKSQDRGFIRKLCTFYNYMMPTDLANFTNASDTSKSAANETSVALQHNDVNANNNIQRDDVGMAISQTAGEVLPSSGETAVLFQRLSRDSTISADNVTTAKHNNNDTTCTPAECSSNLEVNAKNATTIPKFPGNLPPSGFAISHTDEQSPNGPKSETKQLAAPDIVNEIDDTFCPAISFFPNLAFSFGEAKRRLEKLFSDNVHDARLLTAFRFDTTAFNMIRALGALLRFLDQQRIGVEFESYEVKTPINVIKTMNLNELLEVDSTTVLALEIFHSDYNPATIRRKFVFGRARKEGSSLFGLCNICRCTPGRHMLRYWFECPTKCHEVLAKRNEAISFFYHDCNVDAGRFLRNTLKDVMSVRGIINRMNSGNVSINDWKNLYLTLCALVRVGEFVQEREIKLKILSDKMSHFGDELMRLTNVFTEMVDFRDSLNECRFVVNRGVDTQLDELKDTYEQLPEMLTSIARAEAEEFGIESCSVAYVPIIGYLLVIPEAYAIPTNSLIQLIFSAEGMSHYKSRRMQRLDEQIGDVKMQIIDIETTITLRLQRLVLQRASTVLHAVEVAATLDCVLSLAVVAREYNWVRPRFVSERVIDISNARHPVAELLCKNSAFVPNPIKSSERDGKVKILSGPNASGKSVYLKMVGVIIYLAHVGSFVPADRAIIGPINRIMSRMYTVESVLDGMSSFANDLKQMSGAIRRSDGSSLLIIDEFGKGTVTEVGLSLLASCLNYWLEKEPADSCPHLFVASHFHALRNFLNDTDMVCYKTMDVIRKEDDELEFQFRLVDGVIDNSFASVTALKMNIPRHIVDRAEEIYLHLKVGLSLAELDVVDKEESEKHLVLSQRMENLLEQFRNWNMETNPREFLALAKKVLAPEEKCTNETIPPKETPSINIVTRSTQLSTITADDYQTPIGLEREIRHEVFQTRHDSDQQQTLLTQTIAVIQEKLIEPCDVSSSIEL